MTQLESDLTKVSFIWKIFIKALTPYLQMVKTYIYKGDLYDPYFEFFVKIKQDSDMVWHGVSSQQDFVLDERNCLPNFLLPIETELYKTGVTLALLKRVEWGISSRKYYSICILQPQSFDLETDLKILTLRIKEYGKVY